MRRLCGIAILLLLVRPLVGEESLSERLIRDGVSMGGGEVARLPAPFLRDGLPPAEQRQAVEELLNKKHTWEAFTRNSVVAPFLIKIIDNETAGGQGMGRRVDVSFVAYGSLQQVQSDDFLQARFQGNDFNNAEQGNRATLLTAEELQARNLPVPRTPDDPRWTAVEATLFEKVRVSTTTRNERTTGRDSVLVASVLDSQFDADRTYPNLWRSLGRDDKGRKQLGQPQAYAGLGSYVKVTRLVEPAGSLLIEYHVAFAEPQGWFQGANLLRSKLPLAAQDSVRKFRRTLAEKR